MGKKIKNPKKLKKKTKDSLKILFFSIQIPLSLFFIAIIYDTIEQVGGELVFSGFKVTFATFLSLILSWIVMLPLFTYILRKRKQVFGQ